MNLGAPKTFLQPLIVLLLTVDFRIYDSQIKSISFLILKKSVRVTQFVVIMRPCKNVESV